MISYYQSNSCSLWFKIIHSSSMSKINKEGIVQPRGYEVDIQSEKGSLVARW